MLRWGLSFWRYFLDGTPVYLARHYWWAYLWRPAIWFFDHQIVINAILFGQYNRLLDRTMTCLEGRPAGRFLQLTCVYGRLTPHLVQYLGNEPLYLLDVAPAQLETSRLKIPEENRGQLLAMRMNAEYLGLSKDSFSTVLIFFLMHEMPGDARRRVLSEAVRVLKPGGRLVITEYGMEPGAHCLYRFWPIRKLLLRYEPFLEGFWREDTAALLQVEAEPHGKQVELTRSQGIFNDFYRVMVFRIEGSAD